MSGWVSFEEVKHAVSLEMVLHHYRIELRKVAAGSLRGKCPLPMHGPDHKNRASFTATLTKGVGGIWACQSASCIKARDGKKGGNVLDFVATMEGCTIRDAAVRLAEWFGVRSSAPPERPAGIVRKPEPPTQLASKENKQCDEERNEPLTFTLQGIEHKHPYLESRGVVEDTARTFGIGYFPGRGSMNGRIVFPIHNGKGELVAYAGRSIDESEPRYKFPAGFHKSLELFNLHRVKGELSVVLVEGFFDCMNVSEAGYPCVALMGSAMSQAQEDLLAEHFGHVVVMLDGDEAGRVAATEINNRLRRVVYRVDAIELANGAQPDELASDEVRRLLNSVLDE
jgi:DNA primase